MDRPFEVLYEDSDLLVVNKPAGLVCHPTKPDGFSSLISRVRNYLAPPAVAHLVNRLDRETSGIVVIGKHRESAAALQKAWGHFDTRKGYLAIVHGAVRADRASIHAPLGKDESSQVAIKDCVRADGAEARTEIEVACRFAREGREFSLVQAFPQTGRKHQIRIHLAHFGHPVVGDKLYGETDYYYLALVNGMLTAADNQRLILPFHALHAHTLQFRWGQRDMAFQARPEVWFSSFLPDPAIDACLR